MQAKNEVAAVDLHAAAGSIAETDDIGGTLSAIGDEGKLFHVAPCTFEPAEAGRHHRTDR